MPKLIIGYNSDNRIRELVDSAVWILENYMHDANLTTMYTVVIPQVKMTVKSITGSSWQGPNSTVQNADIGTFEGYTENIFLNLAFSYLDLNIDQDRIDESRDIEKFEGGDFPSLRPNYNQQAQTHHTVFKLACQIHSRSMHGLTYHESHTLSILWTLHFNTKKTVNDLAITLMITIW